MSKPLVYVDVVSRGRGLVTCGDADFSGGITRHDGAYLVENEWGEPVGTVRSYAAGARALARHHGCGPVTVEIDHEWRGQR